MKPTEQIALLKRTGRKVRFVNIPIGSVFFYMNTFWVRTDTYAGTELVPHGVCLGAACSFGLEKGSKTVEAVTIVCNPGQGFHFKHSEVPHD